MGTKSVDDSHRSLVGLEAIARYLGRGKNTVRRLHREEDFPMVEVAGRWTSTRRQIDHWLEMQVARRASGRES